MQNSLFDISLSGDGTISKLMLKNDRYAMNWCSGIVGWGSIKIYDDTQYVDGYGTEVCIRKSQVIFKRPMAVFD